jgi:uncharacterized membrane protein required for colicin V production
MHALAMTLTTPDTIVLVACGALGIRGALKGFAWQAVRTVGLIGALWGATAFHEPFGTWLSEDTPVPGIAAPIVGWLLILFGILLVGAYLAHLARGLVRSANLSGVDRILGFLLGALMGLVLSAVGFVVWGKFVGEEDLRETLDGSTSAFYMAKTVDVLDPLFPDSVRARFAKALAALEAAAEIEDVPGGGEKAGEEGDDGGD